MAAPYMDELMLAGTSLLTPPYVPQSISPMNGTAPGNGVMFDDQV